MDLTRPVKLQGPWLSIEKSPLLGYTYYWLFELRFFLATGNSNFLGESDPSTLLKKGIFNKNVCQGHKSRVCLCAKSDVQDIFKSYKNPFLAGRQNLFSLTKTTVISVAKSFLMIMNCWAFLLCICVLEDCMGASRVIIF